MPDDYKRFRKIFEEIEKDKATIAWRRKTKRAIVDREKLLTRGMIEDIIKKNQSYTYTYRGQEYTITKADLKAANKASARNYIARKGVTFQTLLQKTNDETKSRSADQIKNAHLFKIKNNILIFLTDKTEDSKWSKPKHRCTVELKSFDMPDEFDERSSYKATAKKVINGKVGVYCDCEDFQYRRNYWVTKIGSYVNQEADKSIRRTFPFIGKKTAFTNTPKESSFPKITHPDGSKGPLCIHLIRAKKELEKAMTVNRIAQEMARLAKSKVDADEVEDVTITDEMLDGLEKKIGKDKLISVRDKWVDQKAKKSHSRFKQATKAFSGFFKTMMSKEIKKREKLEKERVEGIKDMLRDGLSVDQAAKYSKMSKDAVKEIAKELK